MFRQISWYTYWEFIAVVLVIYYLVVFIIYYRSKGMGLQLIKLLRKGSPTTTNSTVKPKAETLESLLAEIQISIHQAQRNGSPKEEILFGLHSLINSEKFQDIDQQFSKNGINDFVSKTFEDIHSIHLNEEDLAVMWI
jgi:hypothetical protein